eukprot:COSAG06_NODE_39753_length_409_cov_0.803226_2_plen_71_part_01
MLLIACVPGERTPEVLLKLASKGGEFAEALKMRYMETSAKTGENVEETFMLTAREIKAKGVPKPKPSAAQT